MSYSDSVEQAITNIKQQTLLMQRCLDNHKLMDALKFTSIMLTELRNPKLLPKQYYELYISIFDSLSILSTYLIENHSNEHHLADLYELVQYAGNVIPRLYLMITVGTSYLKIEDSPKAEILKDMIEMCRGVQNPIRGIFLRYFLSQRTKQLLPEDSIEFDSQFIITNFIEMNKLWVRLQHQGPLRERDQRTKERKELQILIGSQLVGLSQIIDDNLTVYENEILPIILEQIIQCRDVVCQEYLYDIICQVFPDEFHMKTLEPLLNTLLHLNPEVSITKLILTLVDRLNGYMERQIQDKSIENDTPIEKNHNLFQIFWDYLNKLNEERPDLSIQEIVGIIEGIINLSLTWYPENFDNLDKLYGLTVEKCKDFASSKNSNESQYLMFDILTLHHLENITDSASFYFSLMTKCESFQALLALQTPDLQVKVLTKIINSFLNKSNQIQNTKGPESDQLSITSKQQLERILTIIEPMIIYRKASNNNQHSGSKQMENANVLLDINQENLTKFCHFLIQLTTTSKTFKTVESQVEIVLIIKNKFHKGGKNIIFTYPAIITNFWKLIRKCDILKKKITKKQQYYNNLMKQIFKYISRCTSDLFNICGSSFINTIYKLNLQSAALADQLSFDEISYDFFSEAFTLFEETLSDSKTQFQALVYMTQILQKTRSLYKENYYNSLIVRATLHGSKLLKKQDQCRAVYLCSHLWWATEIASIGEEEGKTSDFFREGKRVLECLQRSLRAADSIMDNVESCELMVEILNLCIYYFIHGDEQTTHVGVNYINGLIELIKTNLKSLKLEEEQQLSDLHISDDDNNNSSTQYIMGLDGSYIKLNNINNGSSATSNLKMKDIKINDMIQIPIQHFNRTCEYIYDQREIDNRFKAVTI